MAVLYHLAYLLPFIALTVWLYIRNHLPRSWPSPNDFDEVFLKCVACDRFWGGNEEIMRLLSQILTAYRQGDCQAVFITFGSQRIQMLEFHSQPAHAKPVLYKALPMIPIARWGHASNRSTAMKFLKSYGGSTDPNEKNPIVSIGCESEDVFRAVFEHIAATCRFTGEIDPVSRCKVYSGYISPKKV